jgi:multidrug resistance efflux pump
MPISMPEAKARRSIRPLHVVLAFLAFAAMFAVYWHRSGRADLEGEVKDAVIALSPGMSGVFSRIEVQEGQRVGKGQVLARLEAGERRNVLAEERRKLARLETLLPPGYQRPQDGRQRDEENPEEILHRRRGEEDAAERRLQQAAEEEARSAVFYNRVMLSASQGKLSAQDLAAAAASLEGARQAVREAKAAFESSSQARSGAAAEIRRIKDSLRSAGADALPANVRIKNYELQEERVSAARQALDAADIVAPEDGVVTEMTARAGAAAVAGVPCLYLAPLDAPAVVVAQVEDGVAVKLRPGLQCRLTVAGAPDNPYAGYISVLLPKSRDLPFANASSADGRKAQQTRVLVTLVGPEGNARAGAAENGVPALSLLGGAKAQISVLLREPLYAHMQSPTGPAGAIADAGGGDAAPARTPAIAPAASPALAPTIAPDQSPPVAPRADSSPAPVVRPEASSVPAQEQAAVPARETPESAAPPAAKGAHGAPSEPPAVGTVSQPERPDVSVNPQGRILPPVRPPQEKTPSGSSLGPLESNLPLPELAPMRVPEPAAGSPAADPKNSPSLATPEVLDREAGGER